MECWDLLYLERTLRLSLLIPINSCLKKNQNAPRPSEHPPVRGKNAKTFRWDSVYCLPTRKNYLHGGQSRCGLLNRGKRKRKSLAAHPPRPYHSTLLVINVLVLILIGENKIEITRRIYMPRRYADLGPSRVRARIPSIRRLILLFSIPYCIASRIMCHAVVMLCGTSPNVGGCSTLQRPFIDLYLSILQLGDTLADWVIGSLTLY